MILTVTPNPALDKVIFIDEWVSGTPMTAKKTIFSVGGKGLDSSVVLSTLKVNTTGIGFFAGETGQTLLQLIESYGVTPLPIWVDGETRTAHVIAETKHKRHTHVFTGGLVITQQDLEKLLEKYQMQLNKARWIICGGRIPDSLPSDFHRTIVEMAHIAGVPALIDSFGIVMREAIQAQPDCVKMNQDEFRSTFEIDFHDMEDLIIKAKQLYIKENLKSLVITCSEDGILAFTPKGNYHVKAPKQKAVNAAGAGDAASAAIAWRLSEGDNWESALKWAAAAGAAVVLTEGTADCHESDVMRILPDVALQSLQ